MALPDNSSDASAPGHLPIDPRWKKQTQIAALGYAVLCVYYIAILVITLAKVPWASFDQVVSELSGQSDSIVAIAIFAIGNSALSVGTWYIFSMNRLAFWCVVLAAVIAALCFLGIVVFSVVEWRAPESGTVGWWTMSISTVQLLFFSFCAVLLLRVGIVTRRQRKEARMHGMRPLPTTTL